MVNKMGIGAKSKAMKPRRLLAHCVPSLSYIWVAKRGKAAVNLSLFHVKEEKKATHLQREIARPSSLLEQRRQPTDRHLLYS